MKLREIPLDEFRIALDWVEDFHPQFLNPIQTIKKGDYCFIRPRRGGSQLLTALTERAPCRWGIHKSRMHPVFATQLVKAVLTFLQPQEAAELATCIRSILPCRIFPPEWKECPTKRAAVYFTAKGIRLVGALSRAIDGGTRMVVPLTEESAKQVHEDLSILYPAIPSGYVSGGTLACSVHPRMLFPYEMGAKE